MATSDPNRLIDFESEQRVCGAILRRPSCIADIDLRVNEFGNPGFRDIYRAALQLDADGDPIDVFEVARLSKVPDLHCCSPMTPVPLPKT